MLGKLKYTAKHTLIYSLGNISAKLIGFVLLPLYTKYLSTTEYGIFALLEVTSMIMVAVFSMKLSTAMMRWCSSEQDEKKTRSIVFTVYISGLVIILLLNTIFQPIAGGFSKIFFGNETFANYFVILFLSVSLEIMNLFAFDLIRLKEKPGFYVIISLIRFTAILLFNIYFIKFQGYGVKGILLGMLAGNAVVTIITLPFLFKNMTWSFNTRELKNMFRYGVPLIFSTIALMLLNLGDRYIMKYMLSYSEVGIYSIGYKIATITNLFIIQSFQTGFLPIAYKYYDKPDAQRFFSKTLTYYTFALVMFSLVLSLFAKELILLFSNDVEFNAAYTIVPFISLALIFRGMQYLFSLGLHFVKKTQYNAYIVLTMAIVHVGLNLLLIPKFGMYGSAIATIISWFIMSSVFRYISNKFYKVRYETRKIFILIGLGVLFYGVSLMFENFHPLLMVVLKAILVLIFPFILKFFNFYEAIELERIKGFLHKWKRPANWRKNLSHKKDKPERE